MLPFEARASPSFTDGPMKANLVLPALCAVGLVASVVGCHFGPFWDFRTATAHARDNASHCTGYSIDKNPLPFAPSSVEKVEPAISHVPSGPIPDEARLRGALIYLNPAPSLTHEALQRAVECHEVHVLLGSERELPYDPYTLPDTWLDIDAESVGDGFRVAVRSDEFETAQQVLERARRFVASSR